MKHLRKTILVLLAVIGLTSSAIKAQTSTPDPLTSVICSGDTKTLTSSVIGTSYQWYKDGTLITGATGRTYGANTAGSYTVVAINSNGCASDASEAVKIYEVPAPTPTITITNNGSCFGNGSTVELTASGAPTTTINGLSYKYEWRKVGSNTVLSTTTTLSLNTVSQSGAYTVTIVPVWNNADLTCKVTSEEKQVTINQLAAKPTITSTISNYASDDEKRAGVVCERNEVKLTASVSSTDANISTTVTYQWFKDGAELAGETNAVLTLANITTSQSGSYTVVAKTSSNCTATSDAFVIDVKARPAQPTINY